MKVLAAVLAFAAVAAAGVVVDHPAEMISTESGKVVEASTADSIVRKVEEPVSAVVMQPAMESSIKKVEPSSAVVVEPSSAVVVEPSSSVVVEPSSAVVVEPTNESIVKKVEPVAAVVAPPTSAVVVEPTMESSIKKVEPVSVLEDLKNKLNHLKNLIKDTFPVESREVVDQTVASRGIVAVKPVEKYAQPMFARDPIQVRKEYGPTYYVPEIHEYAARTDARPQFDPFEFRSVARNDAKPSFYPTPTEIHEYAARTDARPLFEGWEWGSVARNDARPSFYPTEIHEYVARNDARPSFYPTQDKEFVRGHNGFYLVNRPEIREYTKPVVVEKDLPGDFYEKAIVHEFFDSI